MSKRRKAFNNYQINKNIAKILILHRIWNGYTQSEISDCLNVTFQQVQKYEKCINRLAAENLIDICKQKKWDISLFTSVNPEIILEEWIKHTDPFNKKNQLKINQINRSWDKLETVGFQNYYNEHNPRYKSLLKEIEGIK
jgi:transcriptional regulator with XRE-family HTH domain